MIKNVIKIVVIILCLTIVAIFNPDPAKAALNNANIISDYNFTVSMSATDINNFLIAKGSGLANYTIPEYIDVPYPLAAGGLGTVSSRQINDLNGDHFYGKTVAQLIYDEATEHNISPRVIIATLDKESSAITGNVFRSSTVAAWPMFYMYDETMASCLNSGINCNDSSYRQTSLDYGGMGRQLGYAIAWFGKKYYDYGHGGRCIGWNGATCTGGYEQYTDPVTIDGQSITCQTIGTRILYLYTPHIQTSFYNIFTSFFGDPAAGSPAIIPTTDDTDTYSADIYMTGNFQLIGGKIYSHKAYIGDTLIADNNTTTWEVDFSPTIGLNERIVVFKDDTDTEVGRKTIHVNCHKAADINGDGVIDGTDLSIFASFWGQNDPANKLADLNGDGVVNSTDLSIFASNWGK
jgi:hypothetical protein